MAFLDKLNDIAKNIGDLAGETIGTAKLNAKINSEEKAIEGVYKQIGEYYYQKYQSGEILSEDAAALCAEIDAHNAVISEAKAELESIKAAEETAVAESGVCPSCGKANAAGTKFCQECGTKLEAPEKQICVCGAEIAPGKRFCGECGKAV